MPYQPLTETQFNKAVSSGYSPAQITAFELQRKNEIDALERPKKTLGQKVGGALNAVIGGNEIGKSLVQAGTNIKNLATGGRTKFEQGLNEGNRVNVPALIGDYTKAATAVGGVAAPLAGSIPKAAAQFAGLSGAGALGQSMVQGDSVGKTVKNVATGAALGGAVGGGFGLLTKAAAKAGPATLAFTSGVPKAAIEAGAANPTVSKQGGKIGIEGIRAMANETHQKLSQNLGTEFEEGLVKLTQDTQGKVPANYESIKPVLNEYAKQIAEKFKVGVKDTDAGRVLDFSKSAIVKGGEQGNIKRAIETLSNWDDFSTQGVQDLAARIGALRNFESGAQTRSSAVLGKVYDKIAGQGGQGIIPKFYPELHGLRQEFSTHKKVLDEIGNVLAAGKDKPTQIQGSISRLSSLFKEDRQTYIDVLKKLGEESGTDFLSLLSGTEFQRVLPDFIRGLGGGGAVGVGASVLNPYLLLLAPLFSPKAVGAVTRNASGVKRGVGGALKAGAAPLSGALSER